MFKDLLLGELSIDDIEVCEYIQDKDFPTLNKIRDGKPYPKKIDLKKSKHKPQFIKLIIDN